MENKNKTTIRIIPKVKKEVKFGDIESPTLFYCETVPCVKVPEMNDKHGPVNNVSLEDGKGYFIKDWQMVQVIDTVNFSV